MFGKKAKKKTAFTRSATSLKALKILGSKVDTKISENQYTNGLSTSTF